MLKKRFVVLLTVLAFAFSGLFGFANTRNETNSNKCESIIM